MPSSESYKIKEIFYTLQGEGFHSGRPAVFCRFSGCNLWSGREKDRKKAICTFCDTDFWGTDGINGGSYSATALVKKILSLWPEKFRHIPVFLVCTGGEPMLQFDERLLLILKENQIEIAIETNGTIEVPPQIDWICVSPKAGTKLEQTKGNELKLVIPQVGIEPKEYEDLDFEHFYVQPKDCDDLESHTKLAMEYCKSNPKWKLSLQIHKMLGIP